MHEISHILHSYKIYENGRTKKIIKTVQYHNKNWKALYSYTLDIKEEKNENSCLFLVIVETWLSMVLLYKKKTLFHTLVKDKYLLMLNLCSLVHKR